MKENEAVLFQRVRLFSTVTVASAIVASTVLTALFGATSMGWQVACAVAALAVGIPHGALDHLVTIPKSHPITMAFFVVIYVLIAALSVVAILRFNTVGFMFVLLMSAVHFGIGDAAFINELDRRTSVTNKLPRFFYAAAAGSAPVLIPLVNSASTDALSQVNPSLVNWHQGFDQQILIGVTFLSIASIVVLILGKRKRDAIDVGLLLVLALVTPPLIAFAVYFGCWHAMRHTARLTLSLDSSQHAYAANNLSKAFSRAVLPGVPALVGTFVIAGLLSLAETNFTDNFLWMSLVVVWALTVPHMMVTARLDRAALA